MNSGCQIARQPTQQAFASATLDRLPNASQFMLMLLPIKGYIISCREISRLSTLVVNMYKHEKHHFFPFLTPTPPVSLLKLPRLDLGLCSGPLRPDLGVVPLALGGLGGGFGTSGNVLSLFASIAALFKGMMSSTWFCNRCALRAFSCTLLNFSSKSTHLIPPSSLALRRFGRSKAGAPGVWGVLPSCASALFWRK